MPNATLADVDVRVSGATDAAGNVQSQSDRADLFGIEMQAPVVTRVTPNITTISDADAGMFTFALTVVYSTTMDTGTAPVVTFTRDHSVSTLMPDADHTGWTNGTTYVAGYSIVDANETQAGVDVQVAGAKDLAGNLQVVSDSADLFSIDMQNPVLVSLTPNRMMIAESNVGRATFSLAMVYDEEMNTETTPTLTFPDEKVSSTLTLNASESGWSSNRAYVARYDVADANSTLAGVRVRVSAANDIAGNAQVQSEMPQLFSIDTQCPTDLDLSPSSIAENADTRTGDVEVGKLLARDGDPQDTYTYSLESDEDHPDHTSFVITGDKLLVRKDTVLDFEARASYLVLVRVSDGVNAFEKELTISVADVNEPPTDVQLQPSAISENSDTSAGDIEVGYLSPTDPDRYNTFTYALVSGSGDADNPYFGITGSTLSFRKGAAMDHETKAAYSLRVRVNDGVNNLDKVLTVQVEDANDPPSAIILSSDSVLANVSGATIGRLSASDQDVRQTHAFAVIDVDSPFEIVDRTLKLKGNRFLESTQERTTEVVITASDSGDPVETLTQTLAVNIIANPRPWRYGPEPLDVNADGKVVPFDVLFIINELNSPTIVGTNGTLPGVRAADAAFYYDTTGDGYCTPMDALRIINYLNTIGGPEGEFSAAMSELAVSLRLNLGFWRPVETTTITNSDSVLSLDDRESTDRLEIAPDQDFAVAAEVETVNLSRRNGQSDRDDLETDLESILDDIARDIFRNLTNGL